MKVIYAKVWPQFPGDDYWTLEALAPVGMVPGDTRAEPDQPIYVLKAGLNETSNDAVKRMRQAMFDEGIAEISGIASLYNGDYVLDVIKIL